LSDINILMRKFITIAGLALMLLSYRPVAAASPSSWVATEYRNGDFKLFSGARAADILVSPNDFKVVRIAAEDLALDVQRVTGQKSSLKADVTNLSAQVVLVGTLGSSKFIDDMVQNAKLDVGRLRGQWESFLIATVPHPFPNVSLGLVIVGSDRRGTAFGVFELSQAIGVSPWYWWADVTPDHADNLFVRSGIRRQGPPSVQYRGIFLNDEDWGLQPWAARTFEPELGDIGPRTYARIFELLLRLKANTVWPAMHECTRAFNLYPLNKIVADDYAIVMGSSHAEPMLRNNVTEWTAKPEDYDYTKNPDAVRHYWEERVAENGRFENIYTLGMRGIHDSAMQGPRTSAERIKVLEQIFADQRAMLARHVNPDLTKVPQIFCPYKEVLADYRNGLQVPDDITIVWPDDNFGYLRYLPTPEEQKRRGGFGVYYHISYLGRPLSYLWLETTPPSLIWEEMSKAYDHNVRKFWMLNVGDLKPGEIGVEFFMQMAWDINRWRRDNLNGFLKQWAQREFGAAHAGEIAAVMEQYYRLAFARRPEHLQWYLPGEKPRTSALTAIDYGDELQQRLDDYQLLMTRADRLYAAMPAQLKDAFYELVDYPVRGAALANQRFFMMEKSGLYAEQGRVSAGEWARRAQQAGERMTLETAYYNDKLAGGKWRHMMSLGPNKGQWPSMRTSDPLPPPGLGEMNLPEAAQLGVAIEGRLEPLGENERDAVLPTISAYTRDTRFVDVFNAGRSSTDWIARTDSPWIKLSKTTGNLREDTRITVSIDWCRARRGENVRGMIEISGARATRFVNVSVFNPTNIGREQLTGFVESNSVVAIEAEHFTNKTDRAGVSWQVIPGLGRTGDSVAIFPTNAVSIDPARFWSDAPVLEYRLNLFQQGKLTVTYYAVPTHPLEASRGSRFAVSLDDQTPQVVTIGAGLEVPSLAWSQNVLNATTTGASTHKVTRAGSHVLKIYMIDPGVVLDKIVIDAGGVRPSYLGPPETKIGAVSKRLKRSGESDQ
jgi:Glycosyl hydrolase family 115/Gylcosyl hydrolase family 115 C-terminal domain